MKSIPEIRCLNGIPTFFVDDKPFFARAGELHNSACSNLRFMEEEVWPQLAELHMNSVIAPIYWETIEPEEGKFCFDLLDGLIAQARARDMRLILLWFGLWKNSRSTYVPGWMKQDTQTYFLAENAFGDKLPIISPFCDAAVEKDARAFAQVFAHLRETDAERTVILVQVENEIGILGAERDFCPAAEALYSAPVPAPLSDGSSSWGTAYGDLADESFMAWGYASAIERVAAAGRAEYPIPCYANNWLYQYPWFPGSYPMGGPTPQVFPIWKQCAPSLCALAPDIYVPYVAQTMDTFHTDDNPLVIPEVRKDAVAASYALYAFLHHNALCFSPFGIEEVALPPEAIHRPSPALMAELNIDPSAFDTTNSFDCLRLTYALLEQLEPLYLKMRGTNRLQCCVRKSETDFGAFLHFDAYDLAISYSPKESGKPLGAAAVFQLAENEFLIAGMMCGLNFHVKPGVRKHVDFLSIEEGEIADGAFVPGRILNGDERMSFRCGVLPTCFRVKLYQY